MKSHITKNQNPTPQDDKELLSTLIDFMGQVDGGINNEDFQELKKQMMESGITTEGLFSLLGNNFAEALISRQIVDVKISFKCSQILSFTGKNIAVTKDGIKL